jgi:hypothetical protein
MDRYLEIADWDLSSRKANEVCLRRIIKPALGHLQVRKLRGPMLAMLYAQLKRCGAPGCTGTRCRKITKWLDQEQLACPGGGASKAGKSGFLAHIVMTADAGRAGRAAAAGWPERVEDLIPALRRALAHRRSSGDGSRPP